MTTPSDVWPTIDSWLAKNAPRVLRALGSPIARGGLARLEGALNRALPGGLADAYRAHDGARDEAHALFGAVRAPRDARWVRYMWWLSVDEALAQYRFMRDLGVDWPEARLPIAQDAGGNLVYVDLDDGRCAAWDHETTESIDLASDFGAWMGALAEDMRAGLVVAGSEGDDDERTLTLLDAPPPPAPAAPVVGPDRAARVLLDVLRERGFVALADGADVEPLVAELTRALATRGAKKRCAAVLTALEESSAVDEIFAEDDWIRVLVDEIA